MNTHLIIRPAELAQELGVSSMTLLRWRRQGILPPVINLGPRLIGWERTAINQWLKSNSKMGEAQ
ncbi:helix-turn-helix transcriptional regulator [Aeromonas dhakensis]|uniref:helix-turn-helix transcriptional regulator n=1 Tax=Aeromonas dhakensis TaxID=196024 RepID=UPI0038D0BA09